MRSTFFVARTVAAGFACSLRSPTGRPRKILEPLGLPAELCMPRPQVREPAEVWADTPAAPP